MGTTTRVKTVETTRPKMSAQARPEKMGSRVIGQAARTEVIEVRKIGRVLRAPASTGERTYLTCPRGRVE
jgi:hypothetical protein